MKIYLAGGFYADNWQEKVKNAFSDAQKTFSVRFLDPKEKERNLNGEKSDLFKSSKTYTFWDKQAIWRSDIMFSYIDKGNPAIGTLVEIGLAKGFGKMVVLVVEPNHEIHKDKYFDFPKEIADAHFDNLEDGINFLKTLI